MARHVCTADCWAYLLRYGVDENSSTCDPFAARADADLEALAAGAIAS
jgi:hypothetical protein